MNWRKVRQICTVSYLLLYIAAMVLPRKLPFSQVYSSHTNLIKRVFSELLYYGGPFEPVANFFLLMPIFVIILHFLGRSKAVYAMAICVGLSAAAELLQRFIPGRVGSLRDFALNCAGVVTAYLIYLQKRRTF
jgi:glycopeptide antibiotics resistance protein